ncbi:MAG: hypothetical protein QW292_08060 [Candidatus Parvarchaeota archaeon]
MEKAFEIMTTDLDIFPMMVRKESTIRGVLLVFFISLIIRTALTNGMESLEYPMRKCYWGLKSCRLSRMRTAIYGNSKEQGNRKTF